MFSDLKVIFRKDYHKKMKKEDSLFFSFPSDNKPNVSTTGKGRH